MVDLMKISIENSIAKYTHRKRYLIEKWEKAIKESQDGIVIMNECIELVYDQFILDKIILSVLLYLDTSLFLGKNALHSSFL